MKRSDMSQKPSHKLRNTILTILLVLIVGGGAFAAYKVHNVKKAIDTSYRSAGISKSRDADGQIKAKKPVSILIMGTDTGALGRDYKGRTDTMMLVTMNPSKNKTTITSIPRDTAVNIPGYASESPAKINAAYAFGSAGTAIKTTQQLLNVPIDFYAIMNMGGMEKVINAVGGIDLTPTISFKYEGYTFTKGEETHMDGKKALAYSRMRYDDPQGDYGRQTRQRQVITTVIGQSGSINNLLNEDFLDSVSKQMQTDLTFSDLTGLAQNYRSAKKNVEQTHLQGTGHEINYQSMEVMSQSELQRVTNLNRENLGLSQADTGTIAVSASGN
ncbi:LCP family glycopolymer transferase [Levilactobacillus bambusae]|uniref:LytR family transcriptional regulator n=1 Tax=Levilactobacillus bambusae TaxID=2024736 RepID=A0A2V1MXN8_9LACO|nr:LCP family protein [Levilactobacillus bambusae]PWF99766.1 LytR family transcriptional regulator [Levilactobacillus bambusae]